MLHASPLFHRQDPERWLANVWWPEVGPQGCLVCFPCKTLHQSCFGLTEERTPSPQGQAANFYKKDNLCVDSASCYLWRGFACQSLTLWWAMGRVSQWIKEKDKAALEEQEIGKVPLRVYKRKWARDQGESTRRKTCGERKPSFRPSPTSQTTLLTDFPYLYLKGISDHSEGLMWLPGALCFPSSLPWKLSLWHNINSFPLRMRQSQVGDKLFSNVQGLWPKPAVEGTFITFYIVHRTGCFCLFV